MDDRVLRRAATAWPAECVIGNQVVMGTVRDVTSKGAFFQPELTASGRFYGTLEGGRAAARDQTVTLRMLYRMTPDVEVEGLVRWTGVSDTHGCGGLGLEFMRPPVMLKNHAA
jgi:hypothetical protein